MVGTMIVHGLAGLMLTVAAAGGQQPAGARAERPLPAFQVTAPDGVPTSSVQLSPESQWLLVYLNPASSTSRRLLQAMKEWEAPQLAGRTILIVDGQPAEAQAFIARSLPEELRGMRWYCDADRRVAQALELKGAPVLMGITNGQIGWSLSGVLSDPSALKSVVLTWVTF